MADEMGGGGSRDKIKNPGDLELGPEILSFT